jgi:hypothetical protein
LNGYTSIRFKAGCTIGAKIFEPNKWYVLFKNKDFTRTVFQDNLLIEPNIFGMMGTASWSEGSQVEDTFSGLSIGLNSSLLVCADANIKTLARKRNYDLLTEFVLRKANDTSNCASLLREEIKRGYGWTNLVAVDGSETRAFEVGQKVVEEKSKEMVTRTNHFVKTRNYKLDYHANAGTKTRLTDSLAKLKEARNVKDIFDLLRTHRDATKNTLSASICNHAKIHTVYSYVFEVKNGRSRLYVSQGNPCSNEYIPIEIRFPIDESEEQRILQAYPSNRARQRPRKILVQMSRMKRTIE